MDCKNCAEKREQLEPVPYRAHHTALARADRSNRRLWIVVIILIAALIGTNAAWIWYESQWEVVQETTTNEVQQEANDFGRNLFVGGDYSGKADGQNDTNDNYTP